MILFGQEDYVARVREYLSVRQPAPELLLCSLPLQTEKPDATPFDWEVARGRLQGLPRDAEVLVAFSQRFHQDAKRLLEDEGVVHLLFYDATLDNRLKKEYFRRLFADEGRDFLLLDEIAEEHPAVNRLVEVYLAKCVVDKSIAGYPRKLLAEVIPIQVGAALTPERIAAVTDDMGDNISVWNRRYSEMTAFYWMWKNAHADYLGLCHYRRLWVNLSGIVQKLRTTDVDAVLPLPTLCEHSVYEDYLLKHIPDVWRPMMEVLREQSPAYAEAATKIFQGRIFYASNMCILSRIAKLRDDSGENISKKNAQYCELTGHYWIWKNISASWVGVCRYRRQFDLTSKEIEQLPELPVDVVLTTPNFAFPDVESVYIRDHIKSDWQTMLYVLSKREPEYYDLAKKVFKYNGSL